MKVRIIMDGEKFRPQIKSGWWWNDIIKTGYNYVPEICDTQEEAMEVLKKQKDNDKIVFEGKI